LGFFGFLGWGGGGGDLLIILRLSHLKYINASPLRKSLNTYVFTTHLIEYEYLQFLASKFHVFLNFSISTIFIWFAKVQGRNLPTLLSLHLPAPMQRIQSSITGMWAESLPTEMFNCDDGGMLWLNDSLELLHLVLYLLPCPKPKFSPQ